MIRQEQWQHLRVLIRQWCAEHAGVDSVEEAEQLAQEVAQQAGAAVVEETLPGLGGRRSYERSSRPCGCGRKAKFMGYRRRDVGTLFGVVSVERAYYYCRHCATGVAPWDGQQGLSSRLWTAGVKALVCEVAGRLSYGETVQLLSRALGVALEESSAELIVAEVGGRLREEEREWTEGGEDAREWVGRRPRRLYVTLDGSHAHIDGAWHEVKTGVVFDSVSGEDGLDACGAKAYVAAQEPAEAFGERVYQWAAQAGVEASEAVVVVGDGAEWIWNLAEHHYPQATQVLDFWHTCEHLHQLAVDYYGEGSRQGQRWVREQREKLRTQGPAPVLRALRRMRGTTAAQAEAVHRETQYFTRNAHRMDYPRFRANGLMIGSGPVEAACKVVVGQRLKRSGMRWKGAGADAILAVRAALLSRQYDRIRAAARAA